MPGMIEELRKPIAWASLLAATGQEVLLKHLQQHLHRLPFENRPMGYLMVRQEDVRQRL
jgi:hypothetical protein